MFLVWRRQLGAPLGGFGVVVAIGFGFVPGGVEVHDALDRFTDSQDSILLRRFDSFGRLEVARMTAGVLNNTKRPVSRQ